MRSILEQGIAALLNEDAAKADDFFHKFMVQRARQIFESMRDEAGIDGDDWDNDTVSERYFTEADLEGVEDDFSDDDGMNTDDASSELDSDLDGDLGGDDLGNEDGLDGMDDFSDGDVDPAGDDLGNADSGVDLEGRIDDLEAQLAELVAEFDEKMGNDDDDFSDPDTTDPVDQDSVDGGDDFADTDTSEVDSSSEDDFGDDNSVPSEEDEEDNKFDESVDYDELSESVMRELEAITFSPMDGKTVGVTSDVPQNKTSPLSKKVSTDGAKPVVIKAKTHNGYARETAPPVKDINFKNKNPKPSLTNVGKEPKTELNKFSSEDGNIKSPVLKVKK